MNAKEKLTRARTQLVMDQPFFGSLALRLLVIEDRSSQTAYTNGVVLGYNPAFIQGLSLEETKWLVAHEVMHLACLHHTRRAGRHVGKWNVAADYAINAVLNEAGFKTPAGFLLDDCFDGKSAEAIYALLPDQQANSENEGADQGGADPDGSRTTFGPGEIRDAPGNGSGDLKQAEAQWRVNLAQAAQQAQAMGSLPGSIKRLIGAVLHPAVDWRVLLRHFVEQAARNDYAWLPPSRRYLAQGICLPGLNAKELGRIVIAVDTSGSIDTVALNQFAAEISGILEEYDTAIDVVYCDTRIQRHQVFGRADLPLKLSPIGGGGTDFRPVFDWVATESDPCCLIYFTDLECDRFPSEAPYYPVLWVQTGDTGGLVPFGDIIGITGGR
jgi:predicted metal-dependent peptidase